MKVRVLVEWLSSADGFRGLAARSDRDFSEVEVLADSETEGCLIAAQMVACRPNILPTRTWIKSA